MTRPEETEMAQRDLVKTGITGLDSILADGIPRGNLVLLEGAIGVGKTTLGVEFVYRGASQFDEPGIIVLFEVSPDRLIRDAAQLGWDLPALERERKLKIIFTTRQVFSHELQQADSLLLEKAAEIRARRIFVDGVPGAHGVLGSVGGGEPRDAFHILAEALQRENLTGVLAVEATSFGDQPSQPCLPEEAIADTVIRLRMEEMTRATVRSIEIVKSRGHDFQMGRHTFRIVDGRGIEVYRRVQAPRKNRDEAAAFDPTTRITTGVPGLDALVNGGYLLGSTTVVAGISGVGKSVMGLHYLAEGARLGERSLMLSLDEPVRQIVRNANSIGIDLGRLMERGIVRVQYDTPQEIEIDRHFHDIETIMKEFKPTRVLFDSLSTYGSNLGTTGRTFRDFFHALVALMKECQTATVYNHENPEMLGMASMMGDFRMSSLVDNILLMNWIEMGDAFRLGMTVAKMRANPNLRATHECEIVNGQGMRVLPREIPAALVRPFSSYLNLVSRNPARSPDPSAK
jgi:circadian clock protein KaiC